MNIYAEQQQMTNNDDWEKRSSSVVYSGSEFDVRRDIVSGPDGHFSAEYLNTADGVTVLPFTRAGDVLFVNEWRHSVERADLGLPSGQIEPDDDGVADAARRELREETGYEADRLVLLGCFEPLNSLIDASIHYVVADGCRATAERDPDEDERVQTQLLSLKTAQEMVRDGEITDAKTALALLYYSYFDPLSVDE